MLAVDPVKRITVPEIIQHPFFQIDLPPYLQPLPPPPGPVLGTLSALVRPAKAIDFEIIDGLGRIEEDVVDELALRMEGVDKDDVWACLRRDEGAQGNAVKVAYMLLRDKRRLGRDLSAYEEQERDARLAAMDPRNLLSPGALSPTGPDGEVNPFESEFNGYDDEEEDEFDLATPPREEREQEHNNNFAVLNSSLPDQFPEPHHLASYASARRAWPAVKEKKQHRTKWHFGIRSRSPPMEVMLEIYRTLKALSVEWREKKNLGGLGSGSIHQFGHSGGRRKNGHSKIERAREYDGGGHVDLKAAASVYFVETRVRVQDVVVLMNLQLYMVDSINYLVDFHHKRTYKASTEQGAGKYDVASTETLSEAGSDSTHGGSDIVSPFVFMDVACRLILELAGGGGD